MTVTMIGTKQAYPKINFRVNPKTKRTLLELAGRANSTQSAIIKHCLAAELPKLKKKYGMG